MYCTLIIEAWLKLTIQFDCRYLEQLNTCIIGLDCIVLYVRDGTESKYPSIVFLSIILAYHSFVVGDGSQTRQIALLDSLL